MEGAEHLGKNEAHCHCVRMPDGSLLNRYWDTRDVPREEAYLEDVATAKASARPAHEVYRDLRAAAASGWDFSSRWCDGDALPGIRTTRIVPVDLNAFLYRLESRIAVLAARNGDPAAAQRYTLLARERRAAVDRWLWSEELDTYADYDIGHGRTRDALTAAIVVPLFVGMAADGQAKRTAAALEADLLAPGGLGTTPVNSGEQWDRPNGWAPLQWMAIRGLQQYGQHDLACRIRERWLHTVSALYRREAKLVEKYALRGQPEQAEGGGGGEYPLQDGFGWTNGVTRCLLDDDPAHPCGRARAGAPSG
ncbi:MAG TPA: trehalase family glycosidase, partial [Xanthomonadaceae bacterium]|nr:trehalase family glycosidase [Xanthomonadaceae bacterium]